MRPTDLIWPMLQWGVANLFLLGLTAFVWRFLRVRSRWVDPLIFAFLFIFLTTSLMMLCGLAGALHPTPIFLLSLAGGAVLAWLGRREIPGGLARAATALRRLPTAARHRRGLWIDLSFAALALFIAVRVAAHIWLLPPYLWDSLTYHLPNVAEWVQNHRLVIFETAVDRTFWPANFELFATWFVLFPHHDFMVEMAGVAFYLLACGGVYSIARLLGLAHRPGVWAALLYASTPAPLQHATSGNNDLPVAAAYLFVLVLLLDARKRWSYPGRRLLLIFLVFCMASGTKLYIAFIAPGLLLVAAWSLAGKSLREIAGELRATSSRARTLLSVALVSAAVLLAGYWFLRNYMLFGNPFYPAEPRVFGEYLFEGDSAGRERQGVFLSPDALRENLHTLVRHRIFDRREFHFSLADMTGWGWFAFCCGLPSLALGLLTQARIRWLGGGFLLSLLVLLACVIDDPWYMRFALWFPAVLALAFVVVVDGLRVRAWRHSLHALALACLLLNFAGTLDIGKLPPWMWVRMSHFPLLERSTAALGLFIGRSYYDALETIPPHEAIGYNTNYNGWVYPLYDADLSRQVRYVPIERDTDIPLAMRQRGVRYLFVALPPPEARNRIGEAAALGGLQQIGEGLYVLRE